jgi:hypothetical protein
MLISSQSILRDFIPILHELPVFGHQVASTWLWTVDLSPGFFGQGIIIGPYISLHMLIGAIVGWGILSPYAKHRGWAPGEVDDWATGSRGWIIWVSLASLLADASVKLACLILRPIWRDHLASRHLQNRLTDFWESHVRHQPPRPFESQYNPIPGGPLVDSDPPQTHQTQGTSLLSNRLYASQGERNPLPGGLITPPVLGLGFLVSLIICTSAVHFVFGNIIPWYYTPLAIALSLPMATVGIRSIAETDYNPESAISMSLCAINMALLTLPHSFPVSICKIGFSFQSECGDHQPHIRRDGRSGCQSVGRPRL